MTPCSFESRLAAYHDGELPRPLTQEVEHHLHDCAGCRSELAALRGMSKLIARVPQEDDLNDEELARLHAAVEAEPQPATLSLAKPLMAIAASLLVISGAWLMAIPSAPAQRVTSVAPAAEWERMAMTLHAEPRGFTPDAQVAQGDDRRMTDWMVENLTWNK